MKIGRSIQTLIAAHSALKTGVHAVADAFLAKTSQEDQTLSDAEIPATIARDAEVTSAIATHSGADTGVHGVGASPVCSEAKADGKIATHAALRTGTHGIVVLRKAADQSVTTSVTLENDNTLFLPVAANEVWFIIAQLWAGSTVNNADMDVAFAVPSGGVFSWGWNLDGFGTPPITTAEVKLIATDCTLTYFGWLMGVYVGGSNAGNLQLQFAMNTLQTGNIIMKANSLMICRRLA